MKKIKIFLSSVVLALTFTACSVSDSKTIESTETAFEGTGYFTDFDKYIALGEKAELSYESIEKNGDKHTILFSLEVELKRTGNPVSIVDGVSLQGHTFKKAPLEVKVYDGDDTSDTKVYLDLDSPEDHAKLLKVMTGESDSETVRFVEDYKISSDELEELENRFEKLITYRPYHTRF